MYSFISWWTLGCFWLLVMNNAALSICARLCTLSHVFIYLGHMHPGAELVGHIVTLCWTFRKTAGQFSKAAAPPYAPTTSAWRFQSLHILSHMHWWPVFFIVVAVLAGMKEHLTVVWLVVPWWLSKPNSYQLPKNVSTFIGRAKYSKYSPTDTGHWSETLKASSFNTG